MFEIEKITAEKEPEKPKIDFQILHDSCMVDLSVELPPPPIAISIGTNQWGKNIAFGSYGDFSCIVGESKAKKTWLKSLITACYIGGNSNVYSTEIKGHNNYGKYVIDIDTEQSEHHAQKVFRRTIDLVGSPHDLYRPFRLRTLSPTDRLSFIDWIFNESDYKDKIGLFIIDGIADLIYDINNIEESTMIVQKLMTWTEKSGCHIICLLHLNPGSDKPKGHLGTFTMQKAETIARIKKLDNTESEVTADYARNYAFDNFILEIHENMPYYKRALDPILQKRNSTPQPNF